MMLITILGVASGLIGIISFIFPIEWKNKTYFKIIFSTILFIFSFFIVFLSAKINRIERISESANLLIEKRSMEFTDEGFILASLSFLEQNKDDFPDSYNRAKNIFEEYYKTNNKSYESVSVSSEMEGLIKGIAIISRTD